MKLLTKRRGALPFLALIALCSGCAARPAVPQAPVLVRALICPAPEKPVLPALNPALPFDAPASVALLLERDDILRAHIKGIWAALECYVSHTERVSP